MNSGKISNTPGSQSDLSATKRPGGSVGGDLRSKASEAGSRLASAAQQSVDEAKRATSSLAGEANERVKSLLDHQVAAGADVISDVARSVRAAADTLNERVPQLANVARSASDQIEAFSRDIRQQSAAELATTITHFARRRPAVVFGVAAGLGFVAFRLLNAAGSGRSREYDIPGRTGTDWRPDPRTGGPGYPVATSPGAGGSSTYPNVAPVSSQHSPPISPNSGQFHGA
jgi:ElaB/YqjD/DUF883 family membrane-anchored ribosome-binding protein